MKAILVIDIDEEDIGREVNYISVKGGGMSYTVGTMGKDARLRPMPEQMSWGHTADYIYGWNECLDEIMGETE